VEYLCKKTGGFPLNLLNWFKATYHQYSEFLLVCVIISILNLVFFYKVVLLGLVPTGTDMLNIFPLFSNPSLTVQNLYLSDVATFYEPNFWFHHISVMAYQFPLWNPLSGGGVPQIANMNSSFFFILTLPILLFGLSKFTLFFYYFLKLFLVAIFTFYYLKSIKLNFYPALIGAVSFMYISYNILWLYFGNSSAIFILPALLYLIELIIQRSDDIRLYLGFTVLFAIGIFAGHIESIFHIGIISFVYLIFRLLSVNYVQIKKIKVIIKYCIFSLLGLGLSAIQLLPFSEYLFNSNVWVQRTEFVFAFDWRMSILNLIPDFYGSHATSQNFPYYIKIANQLEAAGGYIGISMICLAVFVLITKYKDRMVIFYSILCILILGVVYALPGIYDVSHLIPIFSKIKNTRLLFIFGFSLIVLGSIGLNEILNSKSSEKKQLLQKFLISVLTVIIILLCLYIVNIHYIYLLSLANLSTFNNNILSYQNLLVIQVIGIILLTFIGIIVYICYRDNSSIRKIFLVLFFIFIFLQTGFHGMSYLSFQEERNYYPKIQAFDFINDQNDGLYRTTAIDRYGSIYPVNTQMIYNISDIRDYDALEIGDYWTVFSRFSNGSLYGWIDLYDVNKNFLNFMNVKWVFSRDLTYNGNLSGFKLVKQFSGYRLYENPDVFSRVFTVNEAIMSSNKSKIIEILASPSFAWNSSVVILSEADRIVTYPKGESQIKIINNTPNFVGIEATTTEHCFLVMSDTYYPGWNVYINNNKSQILNANYAFRAIELNSGYNYIEFRYEPISFYVGSLVSVISLIILLAAYFVFGRKKQGK
jgi:hypothetical protein